MENGQFEVELVWNREFSYVIFGEPHETIEQAISAAEDIQNSGDGARVKKTRVVRDGRVVWAYGKRVELE